VISAKASAADRCKSTLSENDKVVNAANGDPEKKFVVDRSIVRFGRIVTREMGKEAYNSC
jgi:hypothetical protein